MARLKLPTSQRRPSRSVFSHYRFCPANHKVAFFHLLAEGFARRGHAFLMHEAFREIRETPSIRALTLCDETKTFTSSYTVGDLQMRFESHRFLRPISRPKEQEVVPVAAFDDAAGLIAALCSAYGVDTVESLPLDLKLSAVAATLVVCPSACKALPRLLGLESIPVATVRDAARLAFEIGDGWCGLEVLQLVGVAFAENLPPQAWSAATPWPAPTARGADLESGSSHEAAYAFPDLGVELNRYDLFALTPYDPDAEDTRQLAPATLEQTRQFLRLWCPRILALDDALAAANA